jgi:hypothetical protein
MTQMNQLMTVDLLKVALPKNLHGNATQDFADVINQLALDPETCEEVRGNFLTYSSVLQEGKWKTQDYLAAVVYVTHKLMGYSNQDSYIRTFPDRYTALRARGATDKDISAYVAAYHKNKLVNAILQQTLIPAHLLYQDAFAAAIQTQLRLMTTANSEKVQAEAANSILTHLKAPEVKKVELDVNVKQHGGIDDLRQTMAELARQQKDLIERGQASPAEMAKSPILRITQEEKASAIDVTPGVKIEPLEVASVDLDEQFEVEGEGEGTTPADITELLEAGGFQVAFDSRRGDDPKTLLDVVASGGCKATLETLQPHAAAPEPPSDESAWLRQAVSGKRAYPEPGNPGVPPMGPRPSLFGDD